MFFIAAAAVLAAGTACAADLRFPPGRDMRFDWKSYDDFRAAHTGLKGETLTILGPWRGEDEAFFTSVLNYFTAATGVNVKYSSSENYEQQIVIDTGAGSPPNIAILPQPGLLANLADKGYLTPLGDDTAQWVRAHYGAGAAWAGYGTYRGKDGKKAFYAFPYKADLKSLVWYQPANFAEMGYKIPATMEDLFRLSDRIVKDGGTPWCIGLGSGGATGWPATDWVEDLMLRMNTPQDYDRWVDNRLKFNDPKVVAAIAEFGRFAENPKYVAGGVAAVASTDYRDSAKGLFTVPPKCYMLKQGSFITPFFPEGTELGRDADFFYFPPFAARPELGRPVEGAGTFAAISRDSSAARAFIAFLMTPIAHEIWMAQSGFLTPYKAVNPAVYANAVLRKEGEILTSARIFRFDASDLMPGRIGAGAFWTGMVDFVGGEPAQAVADEIQRAWNAIEPDS